MSMVTAAPSRRRMHRDPPELRQRAKRGDPPVNLWPGRVLDRYDLMEAYGDPRDWFRYGHRLDAFEQLWAEFADARKRRRKFNSGFGFDQIIIIGPYGAAKTSLAILKAIPHIRRGHPLFSTVSALWGWQLKSWQAYVAMLFYPLASCEIHDEASASHSSRMGPHIANTTASQTNLNTRKKNTLSVWTSAHDWEIASSIRMECRQVLMPIRQDDLLVEAGGPDTFRGRAADNPANFRLAWHVWDNYPYKKRNLIEGKQGISDGGFGPPDYVDYDEGENVRLAYLMNDTFAPALPGTDMIADTGQIRQMLEALQRKDLDKISRLLSYGQFRGAMPEEEAEADETTERLMEFLLQHQDDPPEYFRPSEIAVALGTDPRVAGMTMNTVFKTQNTRNKGYLAAPIYEQLEALQEGIA